MKENRQDFTLKLEITKNPGGLAPVVSSKKKFQLFKNKIYWQI
jgi:hypothetical protein